MNSFPKRWQQTFMCGGAERYHTATLDTIQQHMTFEKATEDSAAKAKGGKKKDAVNKKTKGAKGRSGIRRFQSLRGNPNHRYNNYNRNNNYESHYQDNCGDRENGRGRGQSGRGIHRDCTYIIINSNYLFILEVKSHKKYKSKDNITTIRAMVQQQQ